MPKKKEIVAVPKLTNLENLAQQISKLAKNLANPKDKDKFLELKEKYYREFLIKINKSNGAQTNFPSASFAPYKYYIGKGNNSILVRAALKTRFWWSMGDFEEWNDYQFLWTQWKSNKILDKIKPFKDSLPGTNKFKDEFRSKAGDSSLLSTKFTDQESNSSQDNLIMTPKRQKHSNTLSAQKRKELSVPSSASKPNTSNASVLRSGGFNRKLPEEEKKVENVTCHHVITCNHQENNFHLSNKKAIYYNMKCYYEALGLNTFDNIPLTYHIKEGDSDKEFQRFQETYANPQSNPVLAKYPSFGDSLWIIKPGENTNRGCGIQVSRDLNHIRSIVNNSIVNGHKRTYIIQKYMEKPLLYKSRKFDIRVYAMTTT